MRKRGWTGRDFRKLAVKTPRSSPHALPPMKVQTLFLSWQTRKPNYWWFPVGKMDIVHESDARTWYRFRYTRGAKRAQDQARFPLLVEFPKLDRSYEFGELFPVFQNRVTRPTRPDFSDYVRSLGLTESADAFDILSVSGGRRVTDPYGVFPKLAKDDDGSFACRFFLYGSQHLPPQAQERIKKLQEGEALHMGMELTNQPNGLALQIQTEDHRMIGWAPRYLIAELAATAADSCEYSARVLRNNFQHPNTAFPGIVGPFVNRQILIEMRGRWDDYEPMSGEELQPLAD